MLPLPLVLGLSCVCVLGHFMSGQIHCIVWSLSGFSILLIWGYTAGVSWVCEKCREKNTVNCLLLPNTWWAHMSAGTLPFMFLTGSKWTGCIKWNSLRASVFIGQVIYFSCSCCLMKIFTLRYFLGSVWIYLNWQQTRESSSSSPTLPSCLPWRQKRASSSAEK